MSRKTSVQCVFLVVLETYAFDRYRLAQKEPLCQVTTRKHVLIRTNSLTDSLSGRVMRKSSSLILEGRVIHYYTYDLILRRSYVYRYALRVSLRTVSSDANMYQHVEVDGECTSFSVRSGKGTSYYERS